MLPVTIFTFAELLIVGLLILLAISPILVRLTSRYDKQDSFFPFLRELDDRTARTFVVLMMAYTVGSLSNGLLSEVFERVKPDTIYEQHLLQEKDDTVIARCMSHPKVDCMAVVEFAIKERDNATAEWFNRHKSFIRIARGGAFACLLMIFSMIVYRVSRPPQPRYSVKHFIAVVTLLALFSMAFWRESAFYQKRLYEVYVTLGSPVKEIRETHTTP